MRRYGFLSIGIFAWMILPFNCKFSAEDRWFHQATGHSDVYLLNGDGYACKIFIPLKYADKMNVKALDFQFENGVLQQEIKFKKNGSIIEHRFILHPPEKAHMPIKKEKTKEGYDVFAEKCLQHAHALPQEIKDLLKRKYPRVEQVEQVE
ncbi:MAG: hypothetical protein AAB362_00140 [Patescibacteria group bacterium]